MLFAGTASVGGFLITAVQGSSRNVITTQNARWTHAAIYVGEGKVIEANLGAGVVESPVNASRELKLMRLSKVNEDPSLGPLVAAAARQFLGEKYATSELMKIMFDQTRTASADALYCSSLVCVASEMGAGVVLDYDLSHRPCLPGTLASHPFLDAVSVWRESTLARG